MNAIEFDNVSKQYRLGLVSTGTLAHDFTRFWQTKILRHEDPYLKIGETNDRAVKGHSDYVWALKNIDFKVAQGDVVGIIGRNGAGKSTLLKLLSRVTSPTTGCIRARGRIASLLEVGTGFHPEMTGRENIYMNGVIMGMTRAEITRKLDEIVDFSGCERYLDTPVKRYSSGMSVRLGFAIAAHLEPEILVVDEVLAVGDAEFQKKAIGKMQDVAHGQGRTVLFVSHNMASIRNLCKSCIVLENGKMVLSSDVKTGIDYYMKSSNHGDVADLKTALRSGNCNGSVRFKRVRFFNENHEEASPSCGKDFSIRLYFDVLSRIDKGDLSIDICDMDGIVLCTFLMSLTDSVHDFLPGSYSADICIPRCPLSPGRYSISVFAGNRGEYCDYVERAVFMDVQNDDFYKTGRMIDPKFWGRAFCCDHKWQNIGAIKEEV